MGKGPKQTFLQRKYANGKQAYEKYSTLVIIKEMQIKTAMRYHFTLVKTAGVFLLLLTRVGRDMK